MDEEMQVSILGNEWTVKQLSESEDDRMIGQAGFSDKSTREIGVIKLQPREQGEIRDREKMVRHTIRHEVIHSLIAECGIDQYLDWAENEQVVDFFAYHYPNFKKIFTKLGVED